MTELNKLYSPEFEKQLQSLQNAFTNLSGDLVESATSLKKVDDSLKGVTKTREDLNKQQIIAEKLRAQMIKTDTELVKKEGQLQKAIQEEEKALALREKKMQQSEVTAQKRITTEQKQLRLSEQKKRAMEKERKEAEKQNSAYAKLNAQYRKTAKEAKDLATVYGTSSKQAKKAAAAALTLNNRLKKIDATVGQSHRKVGSYWKTMATGAMKAGAAFLTVRAAFSVMKNMIMTMANFEKAMDKVAAVTGATDTEFLKLEKDAKRLGSATSKSATDVAALQLEFAKLGFSTAEIINATEATISLSIAAGSDLAESATVAASTVKGFGLDARETQRVVDVMAKSFSSSALDLSKFQTAMAAVAPVAKASGKTLEFATSQVSILADNGLDASTAGTSLRNMFLDLNKAGLTWEQGLEKINSSSNKNLTALEMFGKRGATAALILADNADKAKELERAYIGAAGAAADMATVMEDNLLGDVDKLNSAWEGLVLNLNKGEGAISMFFRNIIQYATDSVIVIKELNETLQETQDRLGSEAISKIKKQAVEQTRVDRDLYNGRIEQLNRFVNQGLITREQAMEREAELSEQFDAKQKMRYERLIKERLKDSKKLVDDVNYLGKYEQDIEDFLNKEGQARKKHAIQMNEEGDEYANLVMMYDRTVGLIPLLEEELASLNYEQKASINTVEELTDAMDGNGKAVRALYKDIENFGSIDENRIAKNLLSSLQEATSQAERNNIYELIFGKDVVDKAFNQAKPEITAQMREVTSLINLSAEDSQEPSLLWKMLHPRDGELDALKQMSFEAAGIIADGIFDIGNQRRANDLLAEEAFYNERMVLAGDDILAQRTAERDFAKEKARIDTEQAKADKQKALFDIFLNTAANIVQVAPNPYLIAAVTALGAIQAGFVAARPIPAFDKGSESLPSGTVAIAEKRPEIVTLRDGTSFLQDKPLITNKLTGARVTSGARTDKIMRASNRNNNDEAMRRGFGEIADRINNIEFNFGYANHGEPFVEKNKRSKVKYQNYYR